MYPVSLTLAVPNQAVMNAILAVINGDAPPAVVKSNRTEKVADTPKVETATTTEQPSSDAGKTEVKQDTAAAAASTPSSEVPSYVDTAKYVTKVSQVKGRDTAIAMLKEFSLASLKEAKPEQYAAVIASAKKILGE